MRYANDEKVASDMEEYIESKGSINHAPKDRLDELSSSMNEIKAALNRVSSVVVDCYPTASRLDKIEAERVRHQNRANNEACLRDMQNDCLRRLGLHIAAGARLCWGYNGDIDCKFYLFTNDGSGIAAGFTMQELIANIPKGEE